MTATMTHPAHQPSIAERREAREQELLSSFDPRVPGMNHADDNKVLFHDQSRNLIYRWFNLSRRTQDFGSLEGGYVVSRVGVFHLTASGEEIEVGYLNITHTTPEVIAAQFPTPFHWADENTGASFGFDFRDEVSDQQIWATAYTDLRREIGTPPSMGSQMVWGAYSASDAPEDPQVLAAEIAVAAKHYAKMMRGFVRFHTVPFVDYSRVDGNSEAYLSGHPEHPGNLRGTGIGKKMYLLAAQHLAKSGKILRASGIQSDQAQALWERLIADPAVPTRKTRSTFYKPTAQRTTTYWCLDYTTSTAQTSPTTQHGKN